MELGKVLKFPSKQRRKYYKNKLFSLISVVEIVRTAVAVIIAQVFIKLLGMS